jgi:hypothetical protein
MTLKKIFRSYLTWRSIGYVFTFIFGSLAYIFYGSEKCGAPLPECGSGKIVLLFLAFISGLISIALNLLYELNKDFIKKIDKY